VRRLLVIGLLALALLPGTTGEAAKAKPLLGIFGDPARFEQLTGQRSSVRHVILGWDQGLRWGKPLDQLIPTLTPVPMIGINTKSGWPNPKEVITPLGIAQGKGDAYLVALNSAIAAFEGDRIYFRPLGEMNGHWNAYCAFRKDGSSKGPQYATAAFRKAFARMYLIVHGGPAVNARLKALGLPPVGPDLVKQALEANPMPRLRVIWNPQGYGAPDLPANSAQAYYPGDAYVDVVGNDLYDQNFKAEWAANQRLYDAHPGKPYAFPEWGLWAVDDPKFIETMATFVRTHRRVELVAYFDSVPGSIWDLGSKPKSKAAYRKQITSLG
jgi:hypothetical protein